eukprot:SAG11_NODE_3655_length_2306_cov_1.716357_5_plen_79_part_00
MEQKQEEQRTCISTASEAEELARPSGGCASPLSKSATSCRSAGAELAWPQGAGGRGQHAGRSEGQSAERGRRRWSSSR